MPSRLPITLIALGLLAAAGAVVWLRPWQTQESPELAAKALIPPPATRPVDLPAPLPTRNPTRPQEMIRYPDGTYMPALNGVKDPTPPQWPPEIPYSPVVGRRSSSNGTEWYVHADGNLTTTLMLWRSDVGRPVSAAQFARQVPVLPVDTEQPATRGEAAPSK